MAKVIIIEAFYGGSHKQLLDTVLQDIDVAKYDLYTLPAKKWHWRARTSALYFSQSIPTDHQYEVLFTSSVLNLAELIGMRPDLVVCKKIVYFHENQLIYPVREIKERDCQYGLNQIMTCLAADRVLFNSKFNQSSFLDNISTFLNIQSDFKIKGLRDRIEPKCEVLYFPIKFHRMPMERATERNFSELHLLWAHRWEHDKNPQLLANTLIELNQRQIPFTVSIVGEQFDTHPLCFDEMRAKLEGRIRNFGFLSREDYLKCLGEADIVLSTADHEFYGVSMLEAVHCGCMPIAPNKLVYPEIYPKDNLFSTEKQLIKKLQNWCKNPSVFHQQRQKFFQSFSVQPFASENLIKRFLQILTLN
ncbi:glycosyltransferase-like domain-containing protein 1-like [Sitodiplosis mosellana]|uniref:glycosyltransferase-like domain-containing protein 1-like n=1 Tax=Sitodiplosis mosellana TaxID=263140 RepID=UPI002443C718|nr:glycosyltransferase-like domain-containing protein 1-like [Sitodiplosis mosellana]